MEMELINKDVFRVLPSMESASVDITFTSVPFKPEDMGLTKYEYWERMDCLYRKLIRVTSKAIFIIQSASNMQEYIRRYDPVRVMIWGKSQIIMSHARYNPIFVHQISDDFKVNAYIWSDCFGVLPLRKKNKTHPYQDPLKLYQTILSMFARKETVRNVFDPFMGSGTTGEACLNLGLDFIGVEKDEDFFLTAKRRLKEAELCRI